MKKNRPLLWAFCIPAAIMLAAIVYKEIYPFGDNSFLRVDLYNQYLPFFTELHRKLRTGGSLDFSWLAGAGANFRAIYAYYLASPLNWLLVICPAGYLIEFMTGLIVLKISLCGLSFGWYLRRRFRTESWLIPLFAVFYALSGFMAAYNWNIMWLDCIALAPVIIRGLEELVEGRKGGRYLYCLPLALSMLCNYYISMLLCVFLVLYFLVLIWALPWRQKGKILWQFALYSVLAAMLAGIVLLPGGLALRATRYDNFNFPKTMKFYFSGIEMVARHCLNVSTEIRNDHWPNLYCGAAVFFLLPLYILNRRISWKEKGPRLFLLVLFLLSFSLNVLNFIWHGMNYPNSLPARQSFLYIFLLLTLCFEAVLRIEESGRGQIVLAAAFALGFVWLCSVLVENDDFKPSSFVFTMLYIGAYALLLYWYRTGDLKGRFLLALCFALVITEAAANTVETSVATTSRSRYLDNYQGNRELARDFMPEGVDFYRIEEMERMTKNDGMLTGYPTATLFSSTTNEAVASYYKSLGMATSKVFYSYDGASPLASALLSVRYVCADSPDYEDAYHRRVGETEDGKYLYENAYCLPAAFLLPRKVAEGWDLGAGTPFDVQNDLVKRLGVKEPLYYSLDVKNEEGQSEITLLQDAQVWAYIGESSERTVTFEKNEKETEFKKVNYARLWDLGACRAEDSLNLRVEEGEKEPELVVEACELNEKSLEAAMKILSRAPMGIEEWTDTRIQGRVDAEEAAFLATSIPNEPGWRAQVDGKEAEIKPFGGAMLGLDIPAGSHAVVFTYRAPGSRAGAGLTLLGILFILVSAGYEKQRQRKNQ